MQTLTAYIRNDRIELEEPLPSEWPDGTRITLTKSADLDGSIDITGDSPEAIAG